MSEVSHKITKTAKLSYRQLSFFMN